jgi:hypothetical protein
MGEQGQVAILGSGHRNPFARSYDNNDYPITFDSLRLKHPKVGPDKLKEFAAAKAALVK